MNTLKLLLLFTLISVNAAFASQELEKVSVQLHWKYQFEFAGYIAAKEKGFYKDLGLDVELKEYEFGMDVEEEVVSARSNFGVYNSSILLSHLKNSPINLMASFFKRSAMVIITKPEIKNSSQLVGKNLMAINDVNLRHMFETQNVSVKQINIVKHTYNVNDFVDGKVDAMTAFISNQPYKLDQLGVKYNIIDPSDFGVYILQQELFTTNSEIKNNFERVVKFKDATIKGWEYALKNQEELVDVIYAKYSKEASKESLRNEAMEIQKLILPFTYDVGSIDERFLTKQLELFKKESRIGENITVENFIFNDEYKNGKLFVAKWRDQQIRKIVDYSLLWKFLVLFSAALLIVLYFLRKQRKLNEKLKETSRNLDLGQKIANMGIWELNYQSDTLKWTDGAHNVFETNPKTFNVSFDAFMSFVHPDDSELLLKTYSKSLADKMDYFLEHRIVVNGKIKYVEERCHNLFDSSGEIIKSIGTVLDVTLKKELEESLKESNQNLERRVSSKTQELEKAKALFESIFETVKDGIAIIDLDYRFLLVNESYERMFGYKKEELYRKSCKEITFSSSTQSPPDMLKILEKRGFYGGDEKRYVSKIGEIIDVRVDLTLMSDKKSVLMVVKDVTREKAHKRERESQEKRLLEQSRLAQMGEMLSMIAHQWRQPLAAISSTSAGLELKAALNRADRETVANASKNISKYSQHLSETINDFRDFFKSNKKEKITSYKEVVNSVSNIIKVSIENKNIEFITEFRSQKTFRTFSNELKQVILNLIKNAEDVLLENEIVNPYIKLVADFKENEHVLEISDNGGGVSREIMDKIFDPYFSTKESKNGTGLGLYMSKTIIEDHCSGSLEIYNKEDGALFRITLRDD